MGQTGSGSGTSFENMSHERMLEWLDQANSGAVQGAADKLRHASEEIRKIAEDLKIRPQWVEWKGAGADAFRTWSADLANATLRLGAYSEGASKWLTEASGAIATTQASIPRTESGDKARVEEAQTVSKDSGASAADKESAAALLSAKERDRQEAAAQMRRLAQTYSFSSSQMAALEKPVFPPPPDSIVPEREGGISDSEGWASPGSGPGGAGDGVGYAAPTHASSAEVSDLGTSGAVDRATVHMSAHSGTPVDMEIDGLATLPQSPSTPVGAPTGPPLTGKPDGSSPPGPSVMPPVFGGNSTLTPNQQGAGRYRGTGVRPPSLPGPNGLGTGQTSRMPRDSGISGGRPVAQTGGRPTGGLPVARWSVAKVRMAEARWGTVRASAVRAVARAGFPAAVGWPENQAESSAAVLSSRGVRAAIPSRPVAPVWFGAMVRVTVRMRPDRWDAERTLRRVPVRAPPVATRAASDRTT